MNEDQRKTEILDGAGYCGCCGKVKGEVKLRLLRIAGDGSRLYVCRKGNGCQS